MATPLGNPGDLSPRARQILAEADLVLAEDTRRAMRLFRECGIPINKLTSFHDHNEEEKLQDLLRAFEAGRRIALVSDAGTPLLADPGYRLVRACREAGIPVVPIPGPSAPVAALSAAGIPPIPFSFLGFLPRADKARVDLFKLYGTTGGTLVFFERKDRLAASLKIAHSVLGDREIAICRELTKTWEEIIITQLGEALPELAGEITVIIGPSAGPVKTDESIVKNILDAFVKAGMRPKDATSRVKELCTGWTGKEIYSLLNCEPMD